MVFDAGVGTNKIILTSFGSIEQNVNHTESNSRSNRSNLVDQASIELLAQNFVNRNVTNNLEVRNEIIKKLYLIKEVIRYSENYGKSHIELDCKLTTKSNLTP